MKHESLGLPPESIGLPEHLVKVLVIGTAVNSEHAAECLDIMLVPELVNSI